MEAGATVMAVVVRIVLSYAAAACVAAIATFALAISFTLIEPRIEGMTLGQELTNQAGFLPLVALMTAVLAFPVAAIAMLVSELRKIDQWWFFAGAGALAAIPALFRGDFMTVSRMAEDFLTLGPIGALAGLAYWYARFRLWTK